MDTAIMNVVRVGLAATAFILAMKLIFLGPIKIPGLSDVVAAI